MASTHISLEDMESFRRGLAEMRENSLRLGMREHDPFTQPRFWDNEDETEKEKGLMIVGIVTSNYDEKKRFAVRHFGSQTTIVPHVDGSHTPINFFNAWRGNITDGIIKRFILHDEFLDDFGLDILKQLEKKFIKAVARG